MDAPWRTFGYHVFTDDVSKNKAILITVKHREAYISHLLTPIKKVNVEMLNTSVLRHLYVFKCREYMHPRNQLR